MDHKAKLQFRLLTPDAQRSAIRRLALSGLDDDEIAQVTGWKATDVRRVLEPPMVPDYLAALSQKLRQSGTSGSPLGS